MQNNINDTIKKWGLSDLYETRSMMNIVSDELMKTSKTLDIIAFGLSSLRNTRNVGI